MYAHYNKITKGTSDKNLRSILEELLSRIDEHKKDIESLKDYSNNLQKEGLSHIQKIGLHRFNPFKDTGGDQSFVLSFLDSDDNGIIISALYSRSGTRWYAKRVENGKGVEYELSDEEKKVLKLPKKASHGQ
ncbi:MAG: hypothetical protein A2629_01750 [Candidatus Levybacteria bacterium RIFCSPHIGHO2_01_FULL_41_15]|nr:MAG: hypothetical protein A2629_01750 [Candidatus Levybacteria bacterium RIFCSPHIGHO2_01_FULL_41_15]